MRRLRLLYPFVALLLACGHAAPPPPTADPSSARTTPAGALVGFTGDAGEHVWRGIPFAQPPTGQRRWRAPQPLPPWQETRQALTLGSPCPQYASPLGGVPGKEGSVVGDEDCLYLNVYAPRFAPGDVPSGEARLPVMLWIHGGGNSIGQAGFYDPGKLAAEKVIVVTTNYRLGPFGWLRHAALREGATAEEQSGNFATLDLIAALRWVRNNISAFGGNPDNVTIFGESAGGQNVFSLLVAPQARGLFHRAISQSGGLWRSTPAQGEHFRDDADPGDAHSSNETLLALLQRDGAAGDRAAAKAKLAAMKPLEVAAYLRGKSTADLMAVYEPYPGNGMIEMPKVFQDGTVLPDDDLMTRFATPDGWNHVPVMLGTNHDENRLFMFGDPHWVKRYLWIVPRLQNEPLYVATSEYLARNWKATGADMPAAAMRANADDVYVYRFDWDEQPRVLGADLSVMLGAAHGFEIPFVFDHFDLGPQGNVMWTEENKPGREQLSKAMMGYWAEFARSGRPGRGGDANGVEWLAWDASRADAPKYIVLDTPAGGGIRMSSDAMTLDRIRADLANDPRLANPRDRCAVYHEVSRWGRGFTRADYETVAECKPFPFEQYPWS